MWAFCDCLTDYELNDLGFLGFPFTWCDNCQGDQRILERIDCAVANSKWCTQLPNAYVVHSASAHLIIVQYRLTFMVHLVGDDEQNPFVLKLCGQGKKDVQR